MCHINYHLRGAHLNFRVKLISISELAAFTLLCLHVYKKYIKIMPSSSNGYIIRYSEIRLNTKYDPINLSVDEISLDLFKIPISFITDPSENTAHQYIHIINDLFCL